MAKGILGLVAKIPPSDEKEGGMDDMGGSMGEMAAEDFLSAVKSNDASALYSAFERMKRACDAESKSPLPDASEEEESTGY